MINIIIYEDEKKYREKYISTVLKVIGKTHYAYKIIEIDKYDNNFINTVSKLTGKKIFILDIEVPGMSGLDIAKDIRRSGDWNSQIIISSTHEQLKSIMITGRLLILDFISKYYNLEEELKEVLELALKISNNHKSLNFQYNGEIFQIPYDEILYIEKNNKDNNSTVVTKSKKIELNKKLCVLEKDLDSNYFFRTHRSCIVNINNITNIKLKDNIICFNKQEINLLSREKKNELKQLIGNNC